MSTTPFNSDGGNALDTPARPAGGIIAEFSDPADARAHARSLGDDYIVTPGVDTLYAVRRLLPEVDTAIVDATEAFRTGVSRTPMKALIVGMTTTELKARLADGRLECYPDCAGNTVIRTVEAGEAHRVGLRAERAARADHARRHADIFREQSATNRANGYTTPTPVPR